MVETSPEMLVPPIGFPRCHGEILGSLLQMMLNHLLVVIEQVNWVESDSGGRYKYLACWGWFRNAYGRLTPHLGQNASTLYLG
jgi:hypothetical protein